MASKLLKVAVLIHKKILDQNCQRLQLYGHVVKTANAGSSVDGFGPGGRKCQQTEYCSTLSKLPTLAVLWTLLGPVRMGCLQNCRRLQFYANVGSSVDGFRPSWRKCQKTKDGRMLSKLPTLAVLWTLLGPARI